MNPKTIGIALVLALALSALAQTEAATGTGEQGYIEVERTVELGKATRVGVSVKLTVGNLEIGGGATELLEAEFETTNEALLPEIGYEEDGDDGELEIAMPTDVGESDEDDSEWDITLNSEVTQSLDINVGVGEVDIDMAGLPFEETNVELGIGELQVAFSNREPRVGNATFKVGVGEAHVRIPAGVGSRVKVEVGSGDISAEGFTETEDGWVSDAWRLSEAWRNVDLSVSVGVGDVSLVLEPAEGEAGDADTGDADDDEEEDDD